MPLYICVAPTGSIPAEGKREISRAITRIHCEVTNAPPTFVNVLFFDREQVSSLGPLWKDVSPGCPYQVLGGIRAGRTDEQKERLVSGITGSVTEVLGVGADQECFGQRGTERYHGLGGLCGGGNHRGHGDLDRHGIEVFKSCA